MTGDDFPRCRRCGRTDYLVAYNRRRLCSVCQQRPKIVDFALWKEAHRGTACASRRVGRLNDPPVD